MNRYCVTISPCKEPLTQRSIEVDAHSVSDALYMARMIFCNCNIIDIRAWHPQRSRPLTIWVRLSEMLGGVLYG